MGGGSNPEIVLLHGDRRLRWRRVVGSFDRFPKDPCVDPRVCVQDGLAIDVERRESVQNVVKALSASASPA